MSEWMDVEEVEAFKPILVSWGNRVRNNLYWLKNFADKAFLVDGTRTMQGDIIPNLHGVYNLGSPQACWKYLYVTGDVGEGGVKTDNTSVCNNLNADMTDGYHVGNAQNQIPISNGTVCSGLNADMVDSIHGSNIPVHFVVDVTQAVEHHYELSDDLAQKTYSVIYTANVVKRVGSGSLYLGLFFKNFNTNTTTTVYYTYPTVDIRLHGFYVIVVNDREWGKYPYIFVTHRDTGGNTAITNYLPELSNPPALFIGAGFFVNMGYFNYHASLTVIHA